MRHTAVAAAGRPGAALTIGHSSFMFVRRELEQGARAHIVDPPKLLACPI